jgi:hydroxypyruvate isomerase
MIIRQEEKTPIGDFYHNSGIKLTLSLLESRVDDFRVDTDELNGYADALISKLKNLKVQIKKTEQEWQKKQICDEINSITQWGDE